MLVKLLFNDGGDYERSLKRRRTVGLALLLVGLVGVACYFLLVPDSGLPNFAQGFYLGAASGITLGSVILIARSQYLLTHPEARKKARIKDTDEREVTILHLSFETAGIITFFASVATLFVVLPLSVAAFQALFAMMVLYCLSFVGVNAYLSRKL